MAANLAIFDLDPARRELWRDVSEAKVLEITSGEHAFEPHLIASLTPDLILIDPYDFFDHWGALLPRAMRAVRCAPVLIYIYNKSPRGPGFVDQYRRLRQRLGEWIPPGHAGLLGRLPSDAHRPRAYHEVLLLGSSRLLADSERDLRTVTATLMGAAGGDRAFERVEGHPD